jgi:PadR family transcriptional regulator, regulatory protein PadR
MKGTNLGEFEELVLLTIASLMDDAYSVSICDELEKNTRRSAKLGVVHAVLNRLEEKGLVKSKLGEATSIRGGKRKRFYAITNGGKAALIKSKELRDALWDKIPALALKRI